MKREKVNLPFRTRIPLLSYIQTFRRRTWIPEGFLHPDAAACPTLSPGEEAPPFGIGRKLLAVVGARTRLVRRPQREPGQVMGQREKIFRKIHKMAYNSRKSCMIQFKFRTWRQIAHLLLPQDKEVSQKATKKKLTWVWVRFIQSISLEASSQYSSHLSKLRLPVDSGGGGSGNASHKEELWVEEEGGKGRRKFEPNA